MIGQAGLLGRDEVGERAAGLAAFLVGLLAQEVEALEDCCAGFIGVEFDVVADGVGGEEAIDAARGEQLLRDDLIEQRVGFGEELARLLALLARARGCAGRRLSVPRCGRRASSR